MQRAVAHEALKILKFAGGRGSFGGWLTATLRFPPTLQPPQAYKLALARLYTNLTESHGISRLEVSVTANLILAKHRHVGEREIITYSVYYGQDYQVRSL